MRRRGRPGITSRRVPPLAAGFVVAVLVGVVLTLTAHPPTAPVTPRVAIRAALHSPRVRQMLAGSGWTRAVAGPIDPTLEKVEFYAGPQIVASIALKDGRVPAQSDDFWQMRVPYGDWLAYEPAVLAVLCALFAVMAGVAPWRRLRNLDVAATLSFVVSVVLFQHRYIAATVISALPGMVYLMVRCACRGLGPVRGPGASTSLLAVITPGLDPARRVRWLRALLAVLALVYVMVAVSSFDAADVLYAVMEGATRLIHGTLPYGHMPPDIIHSDTYPILTYLLYTPIAVLAPVTTVWDNVDLGLAVGVLATLASAWAVFRTVAGGRRRPRAPRPAEVEEAGLRAALTWLAFPPLLITASTGTTDVVLAAMLVAAVLLWRRPAACSGMLAVAGWFKLAPFALLPLCVASLRGRRLASALAAVAAVSVPLIALLIALGGVHGPGAMLHAVSYQFSRASLQSFSAALGLGWLQPVAEACVLGLVAAAVVRLRGEPGLAADRARMAAIMASILIALQLTANYWAFLYLVWVVPLAGLAILADHEVVGETVESQASLGRSLEPAAAAIAG